jgi:zinc protease
MTNQRFKILALLVLLTGIFSSCSHTPTGTNGEAESAGLPKVNAEQVPLVGAYKVNRYLLSNGLRLLIVEDHSSPTFAYQTWFRVGSRDEVVGKTGLAHLFEHLMFKATANHPEGEFDRILESAGAEGSNAFTSWDYTAYVQELPKNQLDLIAGLESDRMRNLIVNDQSFKTEREVVQNERRFRTENSPDGTLFQELMGLAYEKNSYHWPVIGYAADLDAMTSQEPRDFYKAYYSPNHATVVISGDVNSDDVYQTIKKFYGAIPAEETPAHQITPEPEQTSPRRKTLKLSIQVEKLLMTYHIPNVLSSDIPALDVLQAVLAGGRSARLDRALVDTGITSDVGAEAMDMKGPGIFVITANLQKGKHSAQAESVILRELKRVADHGVSDAELTRTKNQEDFGFYDTLSNNSQRANFIGKYESIAPNFEEGIKNHQLIREVKSADVVRVTLKYFNPKARTVVIGVNGAGK